ncbi:DUF4974 domain-containing protein [Pseudoflavitalea sp. X16]|uniref:FecR domain-containing protein n=1 Tax=Paraflavitalea devenefica TaxID=2716334 RepID=UPI0014244AF7|nr:FecR domain-containing protein [Paraflavitalea devenefica]NII28453.1 DUF4974 domain-containing protein [Paraflavitalea devenefica]
MPTNEQIQALLDEYVTGNISTGDKALLLIWLNDPAIAPQIEELLQQELASGRYEADPYPGVHTRLHARLQAVMDATIQADVTAAPPSLLRRIANNKSWWAAAAVLIVLLGAGLYWVLQPTAQTTIVAVPETDVPPGGNKATLTLADGRVVMLDSAGNQVIQQGNTTVRQQDGQLVYDAKALTTHSSQLTFNTLSTPRGGQFQVTLPDGTRVWLNAASSIQYPTAFTGSTREVIITGEVYFEVAKNPGQPFGVSILPFKGRSGSRVEVLGTHFNINAYDDEEALRTTLLEGKVKVSANVKNGSQLAAHSSQLLSPGQQAQLRNDKLSVINNPDIAAVMAWKNGSFNFDDKSLKEVMRQLARWYDIEVVYEGKVPSVTLVGEMGRDVPLSKVLAFLKGSRMHVRMEGTKKLVITN